MAIILKFPKPTNPTQTPPPAAPAILLSKPKEEKIIAVGMMPTVFQFGFFFSLFEFAYFFFENKTYSNCSNHLRF